jgi:hypothetical protein
MLINCNAQLLFVTCCLALPSMDARADQDEDDVLAVADLALERITEEDFVGLTDLMIDTGVAYSASVSDGKHQVRTRTYEEQRAAKIDADFVERGFDPTVLVSGPIATVWYPYDFYENGQWSHCGVDIFNLVQTDNGWRIAAMLWSSEQPPDCRPHPGGPPHSPDQF